MKYLKTLSDHPSHFILILLLGFPQLSETIYTPSLPDIARTFGTLESQVELTLGIYFLGFAAGVLLWGALSDRIGRRFGMLLGLVVYTISSLGCKWSNTLETLLFLRLIQGFGASSGSVIAQTMIRDSFSGPQRSRFFSIVGACLAAVPALGPFLGGTIDYYFGWRADFSFLSLLGLFLIGYVYLRLPETKKASQSSVSFSKMKALGLQMIRDPKLIANACIIGASNGIIFSYYGEGPFIFHELLGYTAEEYSRFGLTVSLASFLASVLSHRLNKFFAPETLSFLGAGICTSGTIALYSLSSLSWLSHSLMIWVILGCIWVMFVGIGLVIPNCLATALSNYSNCLGTAGSVFGLIYYILIALFTYGMAQVHDGTLFAMPIYFIGLSTLLLASTGWVLFAKSMEKMVSIQNV